MMASSSTADILPNPLFEGSEKRLEVHFADVVRSAPSSTGLRAISRANLDKLMELAACEIVSCTSNAHLDSYVLSESSLFVYPRTWILKTCGNTKLLNCLEMLLEVARQVGMVPCYGKYSRASFLYPDLQPEEYQSFDAELGHLRFQLGHIGHGGSAFVLGDKLHGLQWHVFVVSEETVPSTTAEMPQDSPQSISVKVPSAPLHTMEVCMTDLDPSAAQKFVRTESFVSSKHTTNVTGIRALMPQADIDDYVFEPCGYSMNGIDGAEHMTIHVTPEDGFSYASCELHGFAEERFDATAMVTSITSIFHPGRLVVSCATKADTEGSSYLWASSISVAGYSCAGATCQELPTGGRVWFYSLVRDCFARCPRTQSCPARMTKWPSFATSMRQSPSVDRMDTLTPRSKRAGTAFGDTGSSASEMDILDLDRSPTASDGCMPRRAIVTALPADDQAAVLSFAQRLAPGLPQDSPVFIVNLAAVSVAAGHWHAALPTAAPLHTVANCTNPEVLCRLQSFGAAFIASTPSDVAALRAADLSLDGTVVQAAGWKPRDVRAAVTAGARMFAVSSAAELAKLQSFAPDAQLLVVVTGQGSGAQSMAIAAGAERIGLPVRGVLVSGDLHTDAADSIALVRRVCCELEEEGHTLEHLMFADTASKCCPDVLAAALENEGTWTARLTLCAGSSALVADALTMLVSVYAVDEEGVHVTDMPIESTSKPVAVLLNGSGGDSDVVDVMDGMHHSQFLLPPVEAGNWLAFHGGGGLQGPCDGPIYYVDVEHDV